MRAKRSIYDPTYHRDGTVTFWSVYQQVWITHCDSISDAELAAMREPIRSRVQRHLAGRVERQQLQGEGGEQ